MCNNPACQVLSFDLLRSLFYDVSDGRFRLCRAVEEFPTPLPYGAEPKLVSAENLTWLRVKVSTAARRLNFSKERIDDIVTGVMEAANNAVVHGEGGYMEVRWDLDQRMTVCIQDVGPGIPFDSLPKAIFCQGYSSTGRLGQGIKLMRAMSDCVWIHTAPQGSTVLLEFSHNPEEHFAWSRDLAGNLMLSQ